MYSNKNGNALCRLGLRERNQSSTMDRAQTQQHLCCLYSTTSKDTNALSPTFSDATRSCVASERMQYLVFTVKAEP